MPRHIRRATIAAVSFASLAPNTFAADQTIVSLPWVSTLSAGPRAQNYPTAQNNMDIWVIEDFTIDRDWLIGRFSSRGNGSAAVTDVFVTIMDTYPTATAPGHIVMQSVLHSGYYESAAPPNWGRFISDFGHQRLRAGTYYIMWQADGNPSQILPVFFAQAGAYPIGQGTPNNAYAYNPGLGWNLPHGALEPVTSGLNHTGDPIGVNFTIEGAPAPATPFCIADFNSDGGIDGQDIQAFFVAWESGSPAADTNQDGGVDGRDVEVFFVAWESGQC